MAAAVAWSLINLRAETRAVAYLNDSSVHEQMVRFADLQFHAGHLPLRSWWPYLGLGSPQFLHYQSLPAMITGLLGLAVGPDAAFRWTLYILLSLWPIAVYLAARLLGADRWAAALSAAMSPFLSSTLGVGYEQKAYLWVGYGVWTQLWASWTLPLAWGFSWRAIRDGRSYFPAVVLVSLTVALHFETGYLALLPLLLWPFASRRPIALAVRRSAAVLAGSLLACAWVIVPLLAQRNWAATNEILQRTSLVNGYGLRVLGWLGSGQLLDDGRLPLVTILAAIGLVRAMRGWRSDDTGRALVVVLVGCIVLSLGRAGLGPLIDVVPGHGDLFFRRFMMGIQLAALLLAGTGAAAGLRAAWELLGRGPAWGSRGSVRTAVALLATVLVLAPAWIQLDSYDRHNASAIDYQRRADVLQGSEVDRLIALLDREGGGRVYAGMPSNWGTALRVGAVPVFKYLESRDVDQVGYTLRTASLMTDPEYYFDGENPSDYTLFGIRYLVLPAGWVPPVPAHLAMRADRYALWRIAAGGYVHAGSIVDTVTADRTNVGMRSIAFLRSPLAEHGAYLRVAFGQTGTATLRLRSPSWRSLQGRVIAARDHLAHGFASATVRLRRPGIVVLSASFDPGWTATVDGHRQRTEMVAPALLATPVPAGTSTVVFRYRGYGDYLLLFLVSGVTLAALLAVVVAQRSRSRRGGR
ncbi:MAG: YfhO family protein [Actinomycetota bacterium]|nr:YfhO family protein [Actinomycetota bacterium]